MANTFLQFMNQTMSNHVRKRDERVGPIHIEITSMSGTFSHLYQKKGCHDPGGGTPILGHIRDVRPEWVGFPGRKPADGCKFLTKNLRMGHNFDIILPGNGWFSAKLNKTYCSLANFYCK